MKKLLIDSIQVITDVEFDKLLVDFPTVTAMTELKLDDILKYEIYWIQPQIGYGQAIEPIGVKSYITVGDWLKKMNRTFKTLQ
jgi:hypothetical protein